MSQDPGQWENQTANQESQQEKEAAFERKWAEMKAEVEAKHHKASNQQQTSNQQQAWAHWEYTPEEWAQLDRLDWGRTVLRYWLTVGPGMLGFLASLALFLWGIRVSETLAFVALPAMLLFFPLLIILLVVVTRHGRTHIPHIR